MIGFSQDLKQFKRRREDEPLETKNASKNELYDMVAEHYMLPPANSKGISREYLLKVRDNQIFRVTNQDFKQFDFTLTKNHLKKIGTMNNSLLVRKLNRLLSMKGEKELGYTEFDLPEQTWLYKVARYIDPTNLLEFFETPARPEPPLSQQSSLIAQVYYGRTYASEYLFRLEAAKRNKKLWEAFEVLAEKYRTVISMRVNVEVLEHELAEAKKKVATTEKDLHDMIGTMALMYTALENPEVTPEKAIRGNDELSPQAREQLNTNTNL